MPAPQPAAMTYEIDKLFRAPASLAGAAPGNPAAGSAPAPVAPASAGSPPSAARTGPSNSAAASGAAQGASTGGGSTGEYSGGDARGEALFIAFHALAAGGVAPADRSYLIQLVQAQTGVPAAEAQARVDEFTASMMEAEARARAAADAARKSAAEASTYMALSLLIGAFIASVSAALGGRLRDEHL
jgi:hypothetical protein